MRGLGRLIEGPPLVARSVLCLRFLSFAWRDIECGREIFYSTAGPLYSGGAALCCCLRTEQNLNVLEVGTETLNFANLFCYWAQMENVQKRFPFLHGFYKRKFAHMCHRPTHISRKWYTHKPPSSLQESQATRMPLRKSGATIFCTPDSSTSWP